MSRVSELEATVARLSGRVSRIERPSPAYETQLLLMNMGVDYEDVTDFYWDRAIDLPYNDIAAVRDFYDSWKASRDEKQAVVTLSKRDIEILKNIAAKHKEEK